MNGVVGQFSSYKEFCFLVGRQTIRMKALKLAVSRFSSVLPRGLASILISLRGFYGVLVQ